MFINGIDDKLPFTMGVTNYKLVSCLLVMYAVVFIYSFGSLYTTLFFQRTLITPKMLNIDLVPNHNQNKSLPVIVKPANGLGNQLFQYSVSYSVARRRNSDLYICIDEKDFLFSNRRKNLNYSFFNADDRSYILDAFNIPQDKLLIIPEGFVDCPLEYLPGKITEKDVSTFTDWDLMFNNINKDKVVQFDGYAESEMFFHDYKNELVDLLTINWTIDQLPLHVRKLLDKIDDTESVAVHVRRRDFDKYSRSIPITYYYLAMRRITEEVHRLRTEESNASVKNVTFFVFSDDIENVRSDFTVMLKNESYNIYFCSNHKFSRIIDFFLMSRCKHAIIANSTFSWWAAYVSKYINKIVIAPLPKFNNHWYFKIAKSYKRLFGAEWNYPAEWITIDPFN